MGELLVGELCQSAVECQESILLSLVIAFICDDCKIIYLQFTDYTNIILTVVSKQPS